MKDNQTILSEFEKKQCMLLATHYPFSIQDVELVFLQNDRSFDLTERTLVVSQVNNSNPLNFVNKKEVFVLLADTDGTTRSIDALIGAAVTSEPEAQSFVQNSKYGYSRSYKRVAVFETANEAIKKK